MQLGWRSEDNDTEHVLWGLLQIDWDNMIYPATVMLAMLTDNVAFHSEAQAFLQKWLCSSGDTISYTPLGRAYNRFNPALGQTMNAALVSIIYGQSIQPPAVAPPPFEVRQGNHKQSLPANLPPLLLRLRRLYILKFRTFTHLIMCDR